MAEYLEQQTDCNWSQSKGSPSWRIHSYLPFLTKKKKWKPCHGAINSWPRNFRTKMENYFRFKWSSNFCLLLLYLLVFISVKTTGHRLKDYKFLMHSCFVCLAENLEAMIRSHKKACTSWDFFQKSWTKS